MNITRTLLSLINEFKRVNVQPAKITLGRYEFDQLKSENDFKEMRERTIKYDKFCGVELVVSGLNHEISIK